MNEIRDFFDTKVSGITHDAVKQLNLALITDFLHDATLTEIPRKISTTEPSDPKLDLEDTLLNAMMETEVSSNKSKKHKDNWYSFIFTSNDEERPNSDKASDHY